MKKIDYKRIIEEFKLDEVLTKIKNMDENCEECLKKIFEKIVDSKKKAKNATNDNKDIRMDKIWMKVINKLIHKGYRYDKEKFKNIQELGKKMSEV